MEDAEKKLRDELKLAYDNLTATQVRCNELLNECRDLRRRNNELTRVLMKLGKLASHTQASGGGFVEERRQEGYEPPPPEHRAHNSITRGLKP